ncbi:hypothetical protein [Thermococcus barophilus]|uniref:Uncharacterized protein n=1 Tax=Thermococcus barophilus TaxID=55802 RepID=A0A0S1XCM2_THEBA|nr:hypothetical protein [Thermococcus barophilus]ALM75530.1 hypothetical protein TBCH5v1_1617 [Thermococcus barophilus]
MKYLFIVNYEDDAERKRIDYLLEKWQERARISKPRGLTFIIETDEISKFAEELFSKLNPSSSKKVESFVLHEKDLSSQIRSATTVLEYQSNDPPEIVKKLLGYVFSKNNVRYYSSDLKSTKYFVLTRKGRVDIEVTIDSRNDKTWVKLFLSGYGEAVEHMAKKLKEDLDSLLEG